MIDSQHKYFMKYTHNINILSDFFIPEEIDLEYYVSEISNPMSGIFFAIEVMNLLGVLMEIWILFKKH